MSTKSVTSPPGQEPDSEAANIERLRSIPEEVEPDLVLPVERRQARE